MAKISLTKLNNIKKIPVIEIDGIEFKQYLKVTEKLDLITKVIENAGDESGFFNIVKLDVFYKIEMLKAYSNINFTDKILENIPELFDIICLNGIWEIAERGIPKCEREYMWNNIIELAKAATAYDSSALGILKTMKKDYSDAEFNLEEMQKLLTDPSQLNFVKNLIDLET